MVERMKNVELTQGYVAVVDDSDYERVSKHKWHALITCNLVYAARNVTVHGKRKKSLMHRELSCCPNECVVDHINGNTLDNRTENLRLASFRENAANRSKINKSATSIYRGVYYDTARRRWRSQIKTSGKNKFLGHFTSEIDAAKAYDNAARTEYGDFARTNF